MESRSAACSQSTTAKYQSRWVYAASFRAIQLWLYMALATRIPDTVNSRFAKSSMVWTGSNPKKGILSCQPRSRVVFNFLSSGPAQPTSGGQFQEFGGGDVVACFVALNMPLGCLSGLVYESLTKTETLNAKENISAFAGKNGEA